MNDTEQARFEALYRRHLTALKLQGMRGKPIGACARERWLSAVHSERRPDGRPARCAWGGAPTRPIAV